MAYIPQLTPQSPDNIYTSDIYHAWNPFENMSNPSRPWRPNFGMPNCTAYAWSRFWAIARPTSSTDRRPTLSLRNAKYWYWNTADGYERGQTARLGAIICFDDAPGSDTGGHVAIVEEILSDGSIRVSNSGYTDNQAEASTWYFWTQVLPPTYVYTSYWQFQGFIYNPYADQPGGKLPTWLIGANRRNNDDDLGRYRRYTRRL